MSDWVAETKSFAMSGNDGSEQSSADSLPPGKVTVAEFRSPPTPSSPSGQVSPASTAAPQAAGSTRAATVTV